MRLLLGILGLLVLGAAPAPRTGGDCASPPSASIVTAWHPRAWTPPPALTPIGSGIRFEPETGDLAPSSDLQALALARRQALARVQVLTRPDGSRHAVLGGLIRAYTVVHVGADGRLTEECVSSEEQARARVQATASSAKRGN